MLQVDYATAEALRYMARTKQRRTYLPYTFPAVAGIAVNGTPSQSYEVSLAI